LQPSSNGVGDAVLWQSGSTTPIDLNTLVTLSSGYLTQATGINTSGQIIAQGSDGNAYLLTPNVATVPLPSSFWLFCTAIVGYVRLKRCASIVTD
jgi:uncharacterized membrane protein